MVRGNWQKRVETAQARRDKAKEKKHREEDKRSRKQWTHGFLDSVDRLGRPLVIDAWTDAAATLPVVESSAKMDTMDDSEDEDAANNAAMKRRARSGSMEEKAVKRGDKKVHPNSKKALISTSCTTLDPQDSELLCLSHFFENRCRHGATAAAAASAAGNKKSCRYNHYVDPRKTLASVLLLPDTNVTDAALLLHEESKRSAEAAVLQPSEDFVGAMEMVHYLRMDVSNTTTEKNSNEICRALADKGLKLTNLVYVVINNTLVFDRNRKGLLLNDEQVLSLVGGGRNKRKEFMGGVHVDNDKLMNDTLKLLPGSILEHALTFLPDAAVAAASRVCKAWYHEIGQYSPNLWRHLLERRNWPLPIVETAHDANAADDDTSKILQQAYREAFLHHYAALRDVVAIQSGLAAIKTRKTHEETEMVYQDFHARKNSPSETDHCVGVYVWSRNQMLAAYSGECTLRLFEAVSKASGEKHCRELICQNVDPYRRTKRRHCTLMALALDDDCVGCLCRVKADSVSTKAFVLVVVGRDDFLLGESSAVTDKRELVHDLKLTVFDMGEIVLDFLLSSDFDEGRLTLLPMVYHLVDFLQNDGDIGDIQVHLSSDIVACGDGRFLVEASISIPVFVEVVGAHVVDDLMHLIGRQFVVFSAHSGAIVWMGESNAIYNTLRPSDEEMALACVRIGNADSDIRRPTIYVAAASSSAPEIYTGIVSLTGDIEPLQHMVSASQLARDEILKRFPEEDDWGVVTLDTRPLLVTSRKVIAADLVQQTSGNNVVLRKSSILSLYPLDPNEQEPPFAILCFENLEILNMAHLRNEHLLLLFREETSCSIIAVVVHISSCQEIGRLCLMDGDQMIPRLSICNDCTIAVALAGLGVVMTGEDVRRIPTNLLLESTSPVRAKKKKHGKKGMAKGRNKDGYARGMSMRG
jgi:hypothetical protein